MSRPRWTRVTIFLQGDAAALEECARLGALCLWLRKETPSHVIVRDPDGFDIADPMFVDWANFPLQEATDAAVKIRTLLSRRDF